MQEIEYGKVFEIKASDLKIDKENYRIDWKPGTTEEEAILELFEEEDIIGMAEDIVSSGGLNPQENFIAIKRNGNNIVLEGNRRLLAIRCMLDRSLVPEKFKDGFNRRVRNVSNKLAEEISKVNVTFMRSKEEALPFIAAKHSGDSILQWGYISMWRHHYDIYVKANKDLDVAVKQLRIERGKIVESIKYHNLINYVRELQHWDDEGLREQISKNRLEMTRWTRALSYSDVTISLGLIFGEAPEYSINHSPDMSKEKFDFLIFRFTKAALLDNGEDSITTRAEKVDIIPLIQKWKGEYDQSHPAQIPSNSQTPSTSGQSAGRELVSNQPPTRRSNVRGRPITQYFRGLVCTVNDQRLIRLTNELSSIKVNNFPAASVMLARALIESALTYQLGKKNLFRRFKAQCREDCNLDKLIKFVITNKNNVFQNESIAESLSFLQGRGGHRKYMNDVVHGRFVDPTPAGVEAIAGDTRELLKAILSDRA